MTPSAAAHPGVGGLALGVAAGLLAAGSSAVSYLISRHHVSEGGSSLRLLVLAHPPPRLRSAGRSAVGG